MAHHLNRRLGGSFIAKREIPHTNSEEKNIEYIVFLDATSGAQAVYRQIMNDRTKISVVICAERSKFGHAEQ